MSPRIAIVGGGLGGLAAALFLRRAGIDATVYEMSPELREAGAGIVVPPNMVRVLADAGLADDLPRFAVRLDAAWEFRRWADGRVLFVQPMGDECVQLYGAACYVAHRGRPAGAAAACAAGQRGAAGAALHRQPADGDGVALDFTQADGSVHTVTADAAIGADGIHSVLSQAVVQPQPARFSGLCAFRCLVPAADAPAMALAPGAGAVAGPGTALRALPDLQRALVNVVAIVPAGRLAHRVVDGRRRGG
jgi:salicylate hydroxylase